MSFKCRCSLFVPMNSKSQATENRNIISQLRKPRDSLCESWLWADCGDLVEAEINFVGFATCYPPVGIWQFLRLRYQQCSREWSLPMCNLYRMEDKDWVAKWALDAESMINLMPAYQMNPDQMGPILRNTADGRKQLVHARWGLPSPLFALRQEAEKKAEKLRAKGKEVDFKALLRDQLDGGTTNVRTLNFPHWKRWFGVEHRCLVPVTSFAEPDPAAKEEGGRTPNAWFAHDESKPLMFFAGVHVPQWTSVRKVKDGLTTDDLYGFLTTDANDLCEAHPRESHAGPASDQRRDRYLDACAVG